MAAMLEKLMSGQRSGTRPFVAFVVSQNHSKVSPLQVLEERIDAPWWTRGWVVRAPQAQQEQDERDERDERATSAST